MPDQGFPKCRCYLDEHGQAVVGTPGSIQIVLVLLGDVWSQQVGHGLQGVVKGH